MPKKNIKVTAAVHKRLLQYKINNDCKTLDHAIDELLKTKAKDQ